MLHFTHDTILVTAQKAAHTAPMVALQVTQTTSLLASLEADSVMKEKLVQVIWS